MKRGLIIVGTIAALFMGLSSLGAWRLRTQNQQVRADARAKCRSNKLSFSSNKANCLMKSEVLADRPPATLTTEGLACGNGTSPMPCVRSRGFGSCSLPTSTIESGSGPASQTRGLTSLPTSTNECSWNRLMIGRTVNQKPTSPTTSTAVAFPAQATLDAQLRDAKVPLNIGRRLSSVVTGVATLAFGSITALMTALLFQAGGGRSVSGLLGAGAFILISAGMTAGFGFLTWRWARGLPPSKDLAFTEQEHDELSS